MCVLGKRGEGNEAPGSPPVPLVLPPSLWMALTWHDPVLVIQPLVNLTGDHLQAEGGRSTGASPSVAAVHLNYCF